MEVDRERFQLRDDPRRIAPPALEPTWRCGMAVVVRGFHFDAKLEVGRCRSGRDRRLHRPRAGPSPLPALTVQCAATPPLGGEPSTLDRFPAGTTSYDARPITGTSGDSQLVAGTIHYPADAHGVDPPLNRAADVGPRLQRVNPPGRRYD